MQLAGVWLAERSSAFSHVIDEDPVRMQEELGQDSSIILSWGEGQSEKWKKKLLSFFFSLK